MLSRETADASRRWWWERLGVNPDRPVRSRWREEEPGPPGTRLSWVDLDSHGTWLRCALLRPARDAKGATAGGGDEDRTGAVVIVPFYDATVTAGVPTAGGWRPADGDVDRRAFGFHLAQRGLAALAVPWWFEYTADAGSRGLSLAERYAGSVARHRASFATSGLGRAVGDLVLAVDAVCQLPWVDPARVGSFGHSLGGKLVLHLAALDERVRAAVAHEPGLGLAHSNWEAPWYLDGRSLDGHDHDELLGLVAPRPFLLAAGGASDGQHNADLVDVVRGRYAAQEAAARFHTLTHDEGHSPSWSVLEQCYQWLASCV